MTPTTAQEPETLTMEDLLREDQNSIRALAHGDIVDGVVVRVDPDEVLVDIGAKSEGIISNRELSARGEQPVTLNEDPFGAVDHDLADLRVLDQVGDRPEKRQDHVEAHYRAPFAACSK